MEVLDRGRAVAVLGEPGLGKSALFNRMSETGARIHPIDLGIHPEKFEERLTEAIGDARSPGDGFVVFQIDSLEEGDSLVRTARLFKEVAGDAPKRLAVHVACRAAEWPAAWNNTLRDVFGQVEVLSLAPFRRDDAVCFLVDRGVSAHSAHEVVDSAGALAARPLTLRFLSTAFQQGRSIRDIRELYEMGLEVLLKETEDRQTSNHRLPDKPRRLEIAHQAAAAMLLTGTNALSRENDEATPFSELIAGWVGDSPPPSEDEVRAVTRTPAFTSGDGDLIRFAHRSYAEYLTASFLTKDSFSVTVVQRTLSPDRDVAPQLWGLLRWLGMLMPEQYGDLLVQNVLAALGDVVSFPEATRAAIVDALLDRARRFELVDHRSLTLSHLGHPGLAEQIEPVLRSADEPEPAVRLAIDIVRSCHVSALLDALSDLALDSTRPYVARRLATYTLTDLFEPTDLTHLRPLIDDPTDTDLELAGTVLSALWPDHLVVAEVAEAVRRNPPDLSGAYKRFLIEGLWSHVAPSDLGLLMVTAREWLKWDDDHDTATVIASLVHATARLGGDDGWSEDLARLLMDVLADPSLTHTLRNRLGQDPLPWSDPVIRRALLTRFLAAEPEIELRWLLWDIPNILNPDDLEFFFARRASQPEAADALDRVIANLLDLRRDDHVRLIEENRADPDIGPFISSLLDPVALTDRPDWATRTAEMSHEERARQTLAIERLNSGLDTGDLTLALCALEELGVQWLTRGMGSENPATDEEILSPDIRARLTDLIIETVQSAPVPDPTSVMRGRWSYQQLAFSQAVIHVWKSDPAVVRSLTAERALALIPFAIHGLFGAGDAKPSLNAYLAATFPGRFAAAVRESFLTHAKEKGDDFHRTDLLEHIPRGERKSTLAEALELIADVQAWGRVAKRLLEVGGDPQVLINCLDEAGPRRVEAIAVLLRDDANRWWPTVAPHLESEDLSTEVAEALGEAGAWSGASTTVLDEAGRWVLAHFPSTVPDRQGFVGSGGGPGLRRSIINALRSSTDPGAGDVLRSFGEIDPDGKWWYSDAAAAAEANAAAANWMPLTWRQLSAVLSERQRPVRTSSELRELIAETLGAMSRKWLRTSNRSHALWNESPRNPKVENAFSDEVCRYLDTQLGLGTVVDREVELRRQEPTGFGDSVDLLVTATGEDGAISVPVECKLVFNKDLETSIESQLAERYLSMTGRKDGVYAVAWFDTRDWDSSDANRRQAQKWNLESLEMRLKELAYVAGQSMG